MPVVLLKTFAWLALLAVCLFAPGGVGWPQAWAVLGVYAMVVAAAFALVDHELLRERAAPAAGSDRRDAGHALLGGLLLYPATLLAAGFDHAAGWSPPAPVGQTLPALGLFAGGYAVALAAMRANRFFTTIVRVQPDRGHLVVDRGPYAWVRHPGYAGTIVAHLALPLALGSWWALVPASVGCLLFLPRAVHEERILTAELPGYAAYRERIRWRLLPGVW